MQRIHIKQIVGIQVSVKIIFQFEGNQLRSNKIFARSIRIALIYFCWIVCLLFSILFCVLFDWIAWIKFLFKSHTHGLIGAEFFWFDRNFSRPRFAVDLLCFWFLHLTLDIWTINSGKFEQEIFFFRHSEKMDRIKKRLDSFSNFLLVLLPHGLDNFTPS